MDENKRIRLFVSSETRVVLEERRLKDEDLQRTLSEAEQTGKKFVHPHTGHFLAGVRQGAAMIWVEYRTQEDGYEIYSAYQHRVEISAWDYGTGQKR